jgi:hypothetical protein
LKRVYEDKKMSQISFCWLKPFRHNGQVKSKYEKFRFKKGQNASISISQLEVDAISKWFEIGDSLG